MSVGEISKTLEIREIGAPKDGKQQISNRRLYIQVQIFTECFDSNALVSPLRKCELECALYNDLNNPYGVGIALIAESPDLLLREARLLMTKEPFASLKHRPELTMVGRTYASGYERDLEDMLLTKPRRNILNPDCPWAIWYPLRRKPKFALLSKNEQGKILGEHAALGRSYARSGYAYDIRLACYGLDENDNDFTIGLVGTELHPLSLVVQEMRKTQQTAKYIDSLGPFFVGKAIWQSPFKT